GGQALEELPRALVRAVLAPQDAEQHRLGPARAAPEQLAQQRDLLRLERHPARAQPRADRGGIACLVQRPRLARGGRGARRAHERGSSARAKRASTGCRWWARSKQAASCFASRRWFTSGSAASASRNGGPPSAAARAWRWTIAYAWSRGSPASVSASSTRCEC